MAADHVEFDAIRNSDNNIAASVLTFGLENILKARMAFRACPALDINDFNMLEILGAQTGIEPLVLRQLFIAVSSKAPCLLQDSIGSQNEEEFLLLQPPTKKCLSGCTYAKGLKQREQKDLEYNNVDTSGSSQGNLYHLDGKVTRIVKVSLRCSYCESLYHYDMFKDGKSGKYHFYKDQQEIIRVTSEIYWTSDLFSLFIELICHCHVTFHGFSEAYNEAFGRKGTVPRKRPYWAMRTAENPYWANRVSRWLLTDSFETTTRK